MVLFKLVLDIYISPPPPPPTPMLSMFFNAIPFEVTSRLRTNFSNDVFHLTNGMEGYSGYLVDQEYSASLVSRWIFEGGKSLETNTLRKK